MEQLSVWVAYGQLEKPVEVSPIVGYESTWVVPPEPSSRGAQTIFLFNGIQNRPDENNEFDILQPVLEWRSAAPGTPARWTVASWYAMCGGRAFVTASTNVEVGDILRGRISLITRRNSAFDYQCEFVGIPSSMLQVQGVRELDWCVTTLETLKVDECLQYPAAAEIAFTEVRVWTDDGPLPAVWKSVVNSNHCGLRVDILNDQADTASVLIALPIKD